MLLLITCKDFPFAISTSCNRHPHHCLLLPLLLSPRLSDHRVLSTSSLWNFIHTSLSLLYLQILNLYQYLTSFLQSYSHSPSPLFTTNHLLYHKSVLHLTDSKSFQKYPQYQYLSSGWHKEDLSSRFLSLTSHLF